MPELTSLVPFLHVADPARSIAFYARLGFAVGNRIPGEGPIDWAWLTGGGAQLMIARAEEPVDPARQAVMFYVYGADVPAMHAELAAAGVAVGPIKTPFYAPRGEFRVEDPDGYVLMFTHSD
jgi:uncharacterized glyoxalase superfamily protein PhnB